MHCEFVTAVFAPVVAVQCEFAKSVFGPIVRCVQNSVDAEHMFHEIEFRAEFIDVAHVAHMAAACM